MEKEKMKKVLMILLAAFLVLSMAGMVSALPTTQPVYNDTLDSGNPWESGVVNVTLNLANDYVVTIPADIVLMASEVDAAVGSSKVKVYSTPSPVVVSVDITLLSANKKINVSLSAYDNTYYDSYHWNSTNDGSPTIHEQTSAWVMTDNTNKLHYAILNGSTHIQPYGDYVNNNLTIERNVNDHWVFNNDVIISSNNSAKATLHMMLIEKPSIVSKYESKLTFKVQLVSNV